MVDENVNISINLDKKNILFSHQGKWLLKNYMMVVAKHYIFKNKFSVEKLNMYSFISIFKVKFQCERYIANINSKIAIFFEKMDPFLQLFPQ